MRSDKNNCVDINNYRTVNAASYFDIIYLALFIFF